MPITVTHHIKSIRPSLDKMTELGFDTSDCLQGTGISLAELDDPDASITLEQELKFNQNLLQVSNKPWIGLQLGQGYPPEVYGMMGYAMISAPTLRQCLVITCSFGDLTYTFFNMSLTELTPSVRLNFRPKIALTEPLLRLFSDRDCSAAQHAFNLILGRTLPLRRVALMHRLQDAREQYENHFGCPVEFGANFNFIEFDSQELETALPRRDIETSTLCLQQCELLIAKLSQQSTFINEVRQMMLARAGVFPSLEQLAENMNMSPRTLRRRLRQENSSYQCLLDEIRFKLAKEYLTETCIPLEEVSELLGYSDSSNLSHAFKRWSGQSPRQWRDENVRQ